MVEQAATIPHFQGVYTRGVDGSRRVMIPADWRPKNPKIVFTAILWPIAVEEFLLVLPPECWQAMLGKLKEGKLHDQRRATLERVLGATSSQLVLDKVGRFCLPEWMAQSVQLRKEAEFVGRIDKFEIWSPKRRAIADTADKNLAAKVAEEMEL